jgi:hypothetical protein
VAALAAAVAVVLVVLLQSSPAPIGYDVSYPQCSGSYPSNVLFAVVGVNGGLAHNTNPCLASEMQWAQGAPGQSHPPQPRLSLYIDTGNPQAHVALWPRGGTTPIYGSCNGLLTNACSYLYGEQRAAHSFQLAAAQAPAARTAPWWLDTELGLSWAGTYALNIAVLRGYIAGLRQAGAHGPIGIYSSTEQWREITGLNAQSTTGAFGMRLPSWVAGTGMGLDQARSHCAAAGFTGGRPTLAQYEVGGIDADLRCRD